MNRGTKILQEVRVERWEGELLTVVFASRAQLEDTGLRLFDYEAIILDFGALGTPSDDPEALIRNLVPAHNRPKSPQQSLLLTAEIDLDDLVTRFGRGGFEDSRSITQLREDLVDPDRDYNDQRRALVLIHRKVAEAVANMALLVAALPLSILYGRSRSVAFGLSLILIISWYLLLTLGQLLAQTGVVPVWIGLWTGNVVLGAVGVYLFFGRLRFR
jgi:lipopolysaccharide export system permease protein